MRIESDKSRADLTRYAWLSIVVAVATISLKFGAYLLTGSVGLLSDAAESIVNLVAAVVALVALRVAAQPPAQRHHFGRTKAEYLSAAVEGIMIFVAAAFIMYASVGRFLNPKPIEQVGIGLTISVVASLLNGGAAWLLIRAGRTHRSITLEADGKHLLTDVWTSVGVVAGVLLVGVTGWLQLDPLIAFLVGLNIIWTGWGLISQSLNGLMDHAMGDEEHERLSKILTEFETSQTRFHSVRTRVAGHITYIDMHVLVPGGWTVQQGHDLVEEVEAKVKNEFSEAEVMTHLEPLDDPRAYEGYYPGIKAGNGEEPPALS